MTQGAGTPLIVTATLPPPLHAWADALRRAHFPPERNFLAAHVTLFHALPPFVEEEARSVLAELCRQCAAVPAVVEKLMNLGGGTAFAIHSPGLIDIRDEIAARFHGLLTGQDSHRPRLHVTIQNKVPPAEARAVQAQLSPGFVPREFAFAGLELHRYMGGPWEAAGRWAFRGRA